MRLLLDILIAFMVIGVLAGVVMIKREATDEASHQEFVRLELQRFQTQIMLQSALHDGATARYPASVDPEWFKGRLPQNSLFDPGHPWCEIASESQRSRRHPMNRTAAGPDTAGFWYNPATGDVRARVPLGISDAQALDLYNYLNNSSLTALFATE